MEKKSKKILIYDGACNVCKAACNTVVKSDTNKTFDLVDAHSERGKKLQHQYNLNAEKSAFVIESNGSVREKSDMVVHILENLGWFSRLFARVARLLPKKAADNVYSFISRNRYRIGGKR